MHTHPHTHRLSQWRNVTRCDKSTPPFCFAFCSFCNYWFYSLLISMRLAQKACMALAFANSSNTCDWSVQVCTDSTGIWNVIQKCQTTSSQECTLKSLDAILTTDQDTTMICQLFTQYVTYTRRATQRMVAETKVCLRIKVLHYPFPIGNSTVGRVESSSVVSSWQRSSTLKCPLPILHHISTASIVKLPVTLKELMQSPPPQHPICSPCTPLHPPSPSLWEEVGV